MLLADPDVGPGSADEELRELVAENCVSDTIRTGNLIHHSSEQESH
jgi:hypothetical protein